LLAFDHYESQSFHTWSAGWILIPNSSLRVQPSFVNNIIRSYNRHTKATFCLLIGLGRKPVNSNTALARFITDSLFEKNIFCDVLKFLNLPVLQEGERS